MLSRKNSTSNDVADGEYRRNVADNLARSSIWIGGTALVDTLNGEEANVGGKDHGRLWRT